MADSQGQKALNGTVWATVDRFGIMVLQFVVNLVLARLLLPADFGMVGVLAIFIAVSQTLVDGGFASALIQRKSPTATDYSTIFFWNFGFSLILYGALFLAAPAVASYFSMPPLRGVLRVISLNLVISALAQVQLVRLKKELAFKRLAIANITAYSVASAIAVAMACTGWGVWSLVAMTVVNQALLTLLYWAMNRWHPAAVFSLQSLRGLFGYGGYMLAAALLQETCRNFQGVIIGRRFSAAQMGYYSQAYKLDQVTSYALPQVLVQVLFPYFSNLQDDREKLAALSVMAMRVITALVFPVLLLLMFVAEPLITGLYGEAWLPCVPYFRILCVGGLFVSLQNVNFYAVAALGHSKVLFRWSFYKWGLLLGLLLGGMNFGMDGIMWAIVISNFNIFIVNSVLARKHVGTGLRKQLRGIVAPLLAGLVAAALSWGVTFVLAVGFRVRVTVWIVGLVFIVCYIILCLALRLRAVADVRHVVTMIIKKK